MSETSAGNSIDPITVEVIGSSFSSIVEEMGEALVRASYSTNIKERRDCSAALFDCDGNTLCQAEHIPMHLGSFLDFIPYILRSHDMEDVRPGDVFVGNDAYEGGGTHLPDIVLAEPVFVDGKITCWAINLAHHSDFLDRGHAHIYQEGLRIPPVRMYREGRLQKDVQDIILLNCQVPHERVSDFRAQMASNRTGVLRVQELCAKYGRETVLAAGRALQDYAERKMRAGISAIPDGTYRFADVYDSPEIDDEVQLSVEVTVSGDTIRLQFTAPPQRRAAFNMTYTALLSTVYYAVKTVVDPTVLPNAGLTRPFTVTATDSSIVNASHPAAVQSRIGPCQRVVDIIHGALAQAVPKQVQAASNGACAAIQFIGQQASTGRFWGYVESIGGGSGARPNKDGLDGVHVHMTNTSNLPVEALEREYPLTVLAYELVDGSAGVGTYRGGMGIRRIYRADAECRIRFDTSRLKSSPWGLEGGGSGGRSWINCSGDQRNHELAHMPVGATVEIATAGGGGYGPPSHRPIASVQRDIAEQRVSPEVAREAYSI